MIGSSWGWWSVRPSRRRRYKPENRSCVGLMLLIQISTRGGLQERCPASRTLMAGQGIRASSGHRHIGSGWFHRKIIRPVADSASWGRRKVSDICFLKGHLSRCCAVRASAGTLVISGSSLDPEAKVLREDRFVVFTLEVGVEVGGLRREAAADIGPQSGCGSGSDSGSDSSTGFRVDLSRTGRPVGVGSSSSSGPDLDPKSSRFRVSFCFSET